MAGSGVTPVPLPPGPYHSVARHASDSAPSGRRGASDFCAWVWAGESSDRPGGEAKRIAIAVI